MQTEQTPCCNAAAVMGRTAQEMLAEKDAAIAAKDARIAALESDLAWRIAVISDISSQINRLISKGVAA